MDSLKPYYQRSLDDFPDDIIVRVRYIESTKLWYAVLNTPNTRAGRAMPDFAGCAKTQEVAIRNCARAIRDDAKGIGKYAPHSCFVGYDLHWILCKYWAYCRGENIEDTKGVVE